MDFGLKGKRALVTGSARGIGMGIVRSLVKEGAKVTVISRPAADVKNLLELRDKPYASLRYYLNRFERQYKTKIVG